MRVNPKASFAAGAVFALVVGSGTAFAATGGNFILGKTNKAGATTSLANANGTALSLVSKAGAPALRVGNQVKIPNLNADKLDNLDSSALALASGATGFREASAQGSDNDGNGVNELFVAVASCPTGTKRVGGGAMDFTASGLTFVSAPDSDNTWVVAVLTDNSTYESGADVVASAVCYNPRGGVTGAVAPRAVTSKDAADRIADRLAGKAAYLAAQTH